MDRRGHGGVVAPIPIWIGGVGGVTRASGAGGGVGGPARVSPLVGGYGGEGWAGWAWGLAQLGHGPEGGFSFFFVSFRF